MFNGSEFRERHVDLLDRRVNKLLLRLWWHHSFRGMRAIGTLTHLIDLSRIKLNLPHHSSGRSGLSSGSSIHRGLTLLLLHFGQLFSCHLYCRDVTDIEIREIINIIKVSLTLTCVSITAGAWTGARAETRRSTWFWHGY